MSGKPLIVHVLYRLDTGGMERILVSLINATGDRYRHAVITLAGFGTLREEIEGSVECCVSLDKRPGKDWRYYWRCWRQLRALRPSVVQTYNIGTLDLAPVVKLAGVRRLVHAEHGRDVSDATGNDSRYQRLRRWMAPLIDRYVTVSTDLRDWLVQRARIPQGKVVYIPNGIDTAAFHVARPRSIPRRKLAELAPPGTLLVGHVARLAKVKDQAGLIRAFHRLRSLVAPIDCRLMIAGDGPERAELQRQIVELGLCDTVQLVGDRDDVPELLSECDVFVLSSCSEGMPVTVLEAMAAGLPVVATDVGGLSSVVDSGVTGTLVPAGTPDVLADALAAYLRDEDLRCRHGEAGRVRVAAEFDLDAMVSAYDKLYQELLDPPPVRTYTIAGLTWRGKH